MSKIHHCVICGNTFVGNGLYCGSDECKRYVNHVRYVRYRESKHVRVENYPCAVCGSMIEFTGKGRYRKYCSPKCAKAGVVLRKKEVDEIIRMMIV